MARGTAIPTPTPIVLRKPTGVWENPGPSHVPIVAMAPLPVAKSVIVTRPHWVQAWNEVNGDMTSGVPIPGPPIVRSALRAEGRQFVTVHQDGSLRLTELGSLQEIRSDPPAADALEPPALSGNGERAMVCTRTGKVRVWYVATGETELSFRAPLPPRSHPRCAVSSRYAGVFGIGNRPYLMDLASGRPISVPSAGSEPTPAEADRRIWDLESGKEVGVARTDPGKVGAILSENLLIVPGSDSAIRVSLLPGGHERFRIEPPPEDGNVLCLALMPNWPVLLVGTDRGLILRYELPR